MFLLQWIANYGITSVDKRNKILSLWKKTKRPRERLSLGRFYLLSTG